MRLHSRTAASLVLFGVSLLLLMTHEAFSPRSGLRLEYALSVGGLYLLFYAATIAAALGLIYRLLKGSFFVEAPPRQSTPTWSQPPPKPRPKRTYK